MMTITAKYRGRCYKCGGEVEVGAKIEWAQGKGACHVECAAKPDPVLNRPPPVDSAGNVDPAEQAAQYGRTAVAGATVVSFSRPVVGGGGCIPNGTVKLFRGRRYVAIAHAPPRCFSSDDLEDFAMLNRRPGLWYDWQGVEVEPSAEERAADEAKAAAKAEEERRAKRRREIVGLVRRPENRTDHSLPEGLIDCWGHRVMAGHDVLLSDGVQWVAQSQSSYGDDWYTWAMEDPALAAEAMALKMMSIGTP